MTKQIFLTKGQVATVDDEDYEMVSKFKWHAIWDAHVRSYYVGRGEYLGNSKGTTVLLHRFILGANNEEQVDHLDHDTLNNTRKNLRICTGSQNAGNQRKGVGRSSKYKGVHWSKRDHLWYAKIRREGRQIFLGCFRNEDNAAHAYDSAALENWGKFACLNFPTNDATP